MLQRAIRASVRYCPEPGCDVVLNRQERRCARCREKRRQLMWIAKREALAREIQASGLPSRVYKARKRAEREVGLLDLRCPRCGKDHRAVWDGRAKLLPLA